MTAKLLLDENLSPKVAEALRREDGVDAVHVRDRGLLGALDNYAVLEAAFAEDRVFATFNVDDFVMLARARKLHPGIVLIEDGDLPLAFVLDVGAIGAVDVIRGRQQQARRRHDSQAPAR